MTGTGSGTSGNGGRLEQIMEMLLNEVQQERDATTMQMEARKGLETLLRREQFNAAELQGRLEALEQKSAELVRLVKERNNEILELIEIAGPNLSPERRSRSEALAKLRVAGIASKQLIDKEASARGNNPTAPMWVPTTPPLGATSASEEPQQQDDEAKLKTLLESLRQH
jgi:hypothetical protein